MNTHNTRRLLGVFGGLLAATSAFSQGVFIDRFKDGNVLHSDRENNFWSNPSVAPSYAQEVYSRLKLHAEHPTTSVAADAALLGVRGWEGNFIRSPKTYSVRGITLGNADSAFVFALNSAQAKENAATASDAVVVRIDATATAANIVRLDWKLNAAGDPANNCTTYTAPSAVHGIILTLSATSYHLTIIHETGKEVRSGGYGTGWVAADWDNGGDASLIIRGIRKAPASATSTDVCAEIIEVGGASFVDNFADSTPANIDSYRPAFWASTVTGSATETGGNLVLRAQAASGTVNTRVVSERDLWPIGAFTDWPKTYVINGTSITGNTASTANRELVFALNSVEGAEDDASVSSDALQLRLTGDNRVILGWKLNATGAPGNVLLNEAISSAVTGARLTLEPWRYTLTVTKVGGSNTFSGFYQTPWNPAQWDNSLSTSLVLRANRKTDAAANSYADATVGAVTLLEPGFYSDFESGDFSTEGWGTETNPDRLTFVSSPTLNGTKAARFEVRSSDANVHGGKRTEIIRHKVGNQGLERWYAFAVYLEDWATSPHGEIIAQWMEEPDGVDNQAKGPTLTIGVLNNKWQIETRWDDDFATLGTQMNLTNIYDTTITAAEKGQWVDFLVHVKWSATEDDPNGLIEIWKNGEPIVNRTGPNCYNSLKDIHFKVGIYRYTWNSNVPTGDVAKRVLYVDGVKFADDYIGLSGMRPQ